MNYPPPLETMAQCIALRKKIPVVEVFGPTIQGEGIDQGRPCHFVRFGGCDFKCEWCDSPHAVLPELVRQSQRMDTLEIIDAVVRLSGHPEWVVLTGGNPCLHELSPLISRLHDYSLKASVETQGTRYKEWLLEVDRLCISPKGPSSGMKFDSDELNQFMLRTEIRGSDEPNWRFLKIVVFDRVDYEFARNIHKTYPDIPFYLSAGNDAGSTVGNPGREDKRSIEQVRNDLLNQARWLTNRVMVDVVMKDAIVQAQYHVCLWGNERGR